MPSPTEAEIKVQIQEATRILNEIREFAGTNSPNYIDMEAVFLNLLETDYSAEVVAGLRAVRAGLNTGLLAGGGVVGPLLREYVDVLGLSADSVQDAIDQLYHHYAENSKTVNSRGFSFGSPAAGGSNVGTGLMHRLTTDDRSFPIEAQTADAKRAEVVQDEHSGSSEHEETFEFQGTAAERDFLKITGSGLQKIRFNALSARTSQSYIGNPSFSQFDGVVDTSLTSLTSWTIASGTYRVTEVAAWTYRDFDGDVSPTRSLKFLGNGKITQNLNTQRATFDPDVPMYVQLAYNREVFGADGTLTLRWGNVSVSVVLAAQTGWQILRIPVGADNWFRQWNKEDPTIEVELSGRTVGELLVDDIVVGPYTQIDGAWYVAVGGATPFLREDEFTWTDTIATDSVIQQWLWRLFGRYLPSNNAGAETWTDPV